MKREHLNQRTLEFQITTDLLIELNALAASIKSIPHPSCA